MNSTSGFLSEDFLCTAFQHFEVCLLIRGKKNSHMNKEETMVDLFVSRNRKVFLSQKLPWSRVRLHFARGVNQVTTEYVNLDVK